MCVFWGGVTHVVEHGRDSGDRHVGIECGWVCVSVDTWSEVMGRPMCVYVAGCVGVDVDGRGWGVKIVGVNGGGVFVCLQLACFLLTLHEMYVCVRPRASTPRACAGC